jgi:hypothetical protein
MTTTTPTYTWTSVLAMVPAPTTVEAQRYAIDAPHTDLIEWGTQIRSEKILTDLLRFGGILGEFWPKATSDGAKPPVHELAHPRLVQPLHFDTQKLVVQARLIAKRRIAAGDDEARPLPMRGFLGEPIADVRPAGLHPQWIASAKSICCSTAPTATRSSESSERRFRMTAVPAPFFPSHRGKKSV